MLFEDAPYPKGIVSRPPAKLFIVLGIYIILALGDLGDLRHLGDLGKVIDTKYSINSKLS